MRSRGRLPLHLVITSLQAGSHIDLFQDKLRSKEWFSFGQFTAGYYEQIGVE
jgi:hypothetical protein